MYPSILYNLLEFNPFLSRTRRIFYFNQIRTFLWWMIVFTIFCYCTFLWIKSTIKFLLASYMISLTTIILKICPVKPSSGSLFQLLQWYKLQSISVSVLLLSYTLWAHPYRVLQAEVGVLKKLSLAGFAKLSQLRYSWLRFGLASAGYLGRFGLAGVHSRLI